MIRAQLDRLHAFAEFHGRRLIAALRGVTRREHVRVYAVRIQGRAALDIATGRIRTVAARADGSGWEVVA